MSNPTYEENISGNGSEVTEAQNSVTKIDQIDEELRLNLHTNLDSPKVFNKKYSSDIGSTNPNYANDRTPLNNEEQTINGRTPSNNEEQTINYRTLMNNEEQTIVINNYEPDSQRQTAMTVCTESSINNEQISSIEELDKSINRNIEIVKDSGNHLETASSVIACNNLKSLSENHNTHVENANSVNINPVPNNFEMVTEGALLESSSFHDNTNKSTDLTLTSTDNSIVISNSNAVPQSDNIVSSNYSLSQLRCYGSDESLNNESHEIANSYRVTNNVVDLCDKDSDSDSSSTSSSSSIVISDSSDSESDCELETVTSMPSQPIKAKGELDLNDLPPIEDLKISVPEEECTPVGWVYKIVDQLVVIQATKDRPALNLDTVLFSQEGKPFGKIFDVFGPVAEPFYCVRFNSSDHIKEKNIFLNQTIYCAPNTKYTNYVFLAQLMKLKGSDASWENDLEPPEHFLDYSDDEQEQQAKKKTSRNKNSTASKQNIDPDEPARKKHFSYEKKMNKRNLQLSAARKNCERNSVENSIWGPSSTSTAFAAPSNYSFDVPHPTFGTPPVFTARVPPSNVGYFSPRPDLSPVSCNMFPSRPNMFPHKSDKFPPKPDMFPPKPDMFSPRRNMFPPRPDMFSFRPDIHPPRPDIQPPRLDVHPPRHDIQPPRFDMQPPRLDMHPPRRDIQPPRPDVQPSRPDMFSFRPDIHPPSPIMFSSRPDMYPPRPDMQPPKHDVLPPRSDMHVPRPDTHSPRPDIHLPRSELFPSRFSMFPHGTDISSHRPNMFPPRSTMIVSPTSNSLQPSPPRCSDPSTFNFSQALNPRISLSPKNGNHSFPSIGPSAVHYSQSSNNQRLRNPYPNQPMSPTDNVWIQRPQSFSFDTPPPGFWPSPQQSSTNQMPHAPPRPSPF